MESPLLSIVLPVYNEGENIREALSRLEKEVRTACTVLVVYDFEEDTTLPVLEELLPSLPPHFPVEKVRNKYGRGVLYAIRTGMEAAATPYVVVTMADLCDPPHVIDLLVAKAEEEKADIVCASRYMKGGSQKGGPFLKGLMSRTAGLTLHYFAGLPTSDPTNSFKLYRKEFLENTPIESTGGFELGIELVVKAHASGKTVREVPTSWSDREAGKSNFKLMKWLPKYLKWYFYAFTHPRKKR